MGLGGSFVLEPEVTETKKVNVEEVDLLFITTFLSNGPPIFYKLFLPSVLYM